MWGTMGSWTPHPSPKSPKKDVFLLGSHVYGYRRRNKGRGETPAVTPLPKKDS